MLRKSVIILLALFGMLVPLTAQNFEGVIEFKKQNANGMSMKYIYYVKGDHVRIDEIGEQSKQVEGSYILSFKTNKMLVLNHGRKLYTDRKPEGSPTAPASATVKHTKKAQTLHNYSCTEYVVRNNADSTEICYWIAPGKFNFFVPMLKMLNRQEAFSTYYFALNMKEGSFPFLAIQKDLRGKEISRLEVTRIEKKTIADALFEIPKDYTEYK
ncbi:MAG: DUF4412 domain-containing protein [Bacteroidia bacterium]